MQLQRILVLAAFVALAGAVSSTTAVDFSDVNREAAATNVTTPAPTISKPAFADDCKTCTVECDAGTGQFQARAYDHQAFANVGHYQAPLHDYQATPED